jgi:hypothetical protein
MEPPVAAAVISSTVALVVAVVGVIATGLAQSRATTRAHGNALDLFDRQEKAHTLAREAQAAEHLRLAHMAEKRSLYVRLPTLLFKFQRAVLAEAAAQHEVDEEEAAEAEREVKTRQVPYENAASAGHAVSSAYFEVAELLDTLQIMSPKPVADAAREWAMAVHNNDSQVDLEVLQNEYLRWVRIDLGIPGTVSVWWEPEKNRANSPEDATDQP